MPVTHVSKVYAVKDCKIAELTADPAGGAATYGASIDVPGIKSLAIGGDVADAELRGDNSLLDRDTNLAGISGSVEHAKISLDALAVILGTGAVVDAGVAPNQTATLALVGGSGTGVSKPRYFRLEGVSASADPIAGNMRFTLYKCILGGFPDLGLAEDDYQTVSFDYNALPRISDGKWLDVSVNETAAVLA